MVKKFDAFGRFAKPFSVGLQLLGDNSPILIDEKIGDFLRQKRQLFEECRDEVFMAAADTRDAQQEALELVLRGIKSAKPSLYKICETEISSPSLGIRYARRDFETCPLALASLLVQEDLVLMRRRQEGWCLVAASLCFPSSWKLAEKFGKPLMQIHKPVPGAATGLDPMIHRIFDNLKPQLPVWRENWSFYADDALRHSAGENEHRHDGAHQANRNYLRREYQTLHRLPASGDILFTIRILVEPLTIIESQENPAAIAASLLNQIGAMSVDQKPYKGFDRNMDEVETYLRHIANAGPGA